MTSQGKWTEITAPLSPSQLWKSMRRKRISHFPEGGRKGGKEEGRKVARKEGKMD